MSSCGLASLSKDRKVTCWTRPVAGCTVDHFDQIVSELSGKECDQGDSEHDQFSSASHTTLLVNSRKAAADLERKA